MACHGDERQGVGVSPPLQGIADRISGNDLRLLVRSGRNLMPPNPAISDKQLADVIEYLLWDDPAPDAPHVRPERPAHTFFGYVKLLDHEDYPGSRPPWGTLHCLDLNTGKLLWQVPFREFPELLVKGMGLTDTGNFGGPSLNASGLIFCSGTRDKLIRAFDADSGEALWRHALPFHGNGPPTIYTHQGRQYVLIVATGGGKLAPPTGDAFVAFALPEN